MPDSREPEVAMATIEARLVPDRGPGPKHLTVWARLDLGIGREWVAVARITGDKR